jgi:hypothetical protein
MRQFAHGQATAGVHLVHHGSVEAGVGSFGQQPVGRIVRVRDGLAVEVRVREQVSRGILCVTFGLAERQRALRAPPALVIVVACGARVGVGLREAVANLVAAVLRQQI